MGKRFASQLRLARKKPGPLFLAVLTAATPLLLATAGPAPGAIPGDMALASHVPGSATTTGSATLGHPDRPPRL